MRVLLSYTSDYKRLTGDGSVDFDDFCNDFSIKATELDKVLAELNSPSFREGTTFTPIHS